MAGDVHLRGPGWELTLLEAGFIELRKSEGVAADLLRRGEAIAAACGEGYTAQVSPSRRRARVTVNADTPRAMHHEAQHNELIKHLDAGR